MYNKPYMINYNPSINQQNLNEQIDNEIERLKQMKVQISQPIPAISQTFQLGPNNSGIRYANTYDEVQKEIIYVDTPFFSKDMSVLWVKNVKGEINSYELKEMVEKDEKDLKIDYLMAKIEELEKGINKDEKSNGINDNEPIKNEKPTNVSNVKSRKSKSYGDVEGDGD